MVSPLDPVELGQITGWSEREWRAAWERAGAELWPTVVRYTLADRAGSAPQWWASTLRRMADPMRHAVAEAVRATAQRSAMRAAYRHRQIARRRRNRCR